MGNSCHVCSTPQLPDFALPSHVVDELLEKRFYHVNFNPIESPIIKIGPKRLLGEGGLLTDLHHQPINVPTAGAQAFHMDYT
jgi:hypothetical protein